jgi:peptidoglycan/LPS O-acetylase OafA/YrhL
VYEHTVGHFGATGAIVVFLLVTALISEALYRWVELPASRWVAARIPDPGETTTSVEETPATARVASSHVLVRRAAGSGNR